jgi:hypothetical protein
MAFGLDIPFPFLFSVLARGGAPRSSTGPQFGVVMAHRLAQVPQEVRPTLRVECLVQLVIRRQAVVHDDAVVAGDDTDRVNRFMTSMFMADQQYDRGASHHMQPPAFR